MRNIGLNIANAPTPVMMSKPIIPNRRHDNFTVYNLKYGQTARPSRLRFAITLLSSLLWFASASAGEIQQFDVQRQDGVYTVTTKVIIDAPVEAVRSVLTDYDNLPQINNSVKSIRILEAIPAEGFTRIQSEIHMCALFFCMDLQQVQDMVDVKPGDLRAFIDAEQSDFASGHSTWVTQPAPDNTQTTELVWVAVLIPDFWVPPAIGPWVIKNKLEEEALETIAGIEAVIEAQNQP